jgi:succinate dehydrogenase / fumarate reductase flavoprotein subunit
VICTGSAAAAAYLEGARFGNPEMVQIHPTAIPGEDKMRLMSESARGEGGRVWVPRKKGDTRDPKQIPEAERWYFLEEKYPKFGNLVPRDIGSREIYHVCVDLGLGVGGENQVFLDLTHKSREFLDRRLGAILEIYEQFVGDDPRTIPMRIFPAIHYSMGGLWVDFEKTPDGYYDLASPRNHMTNLPGLYAAGECEYQYHGANRLGANALLSCIYAGMVSGPAATIYAAQGAERRAAEQTSSLYDDAARRWRDRFEQLRRMQGQENARRIHRELGDVMVDNVTIVRTNENLDRADAAITAFMERWQEIGVTDSGDWSNQELPFVNQLANMLELARLITRGARLRDESRGAHYKPEFPARDDENWLKSTMATHTPKGPEFSFEAIDTSLLEPVARKYD